MNHAKRYNVFNSIHTGWRARLFNIQMKWQQNYTASNEASEMADDLQTFLHHYYESAGRVDQFILGNIIWQEPQVAAILAEDRSIDNDLLYKLEKMLDQLKNSSPAEEREATFTSVFYTLNEFVAFNLYLTNKEETILLPLLWKHFNNEEIISMEQLLITSTNHLDKLVIDSYGIMRRDGSVTSEWMGGTIETSMPEFCI